MWKMKRNDHYLLYMDEEKKNFIDENKDNLVKPFSEYFFYLPIECLDKRIKIESKFVAVKTYKTTILIEVEEKELKIKVHFTDDDITNIVNSIHDNYNTEFYEYLKHEIKKLLNNTSDSKISFTLGDTEFNVYGIAFNERFNDLVIENPAGIKLFANEFIFIYDLILEKERIDKDKNKPIEFIQKTFKNLS